MDFNIINNSPEKQKTDCLVVPIFEKRKLSNTAKKIDSITNGYLTKILQSGDLDGKMGQSLLLHTVPKLSCQRLLLIGCGKELILTNINFNNFIKHIIATLLNTTAVTNTTLFINDLSVKHNDLAWLIKQAVIIAEDAMYCFDDYKSTKSTLTRKLKKFTFAISDHLHSKTLVQLNNALNFGIHIANGIKLTKDLANTPGNICNPNYLAKAAKKLSHNSKNLTCNILEKKDLTKLKMGSFLSVAQGSSQEPKLIVLKYTAAKANKAPIVLVGKGITFDTGGNSLKNPTAMLGMKYDMSGAATVLGLMSFAAAAKLPLNLIGLMACAENMPGGNASRPDDIVTSMSGITIEIANTDAEGRLVLCDTLTYSERFSPKAVIDIATLTGACIIALGKQHSGLFSNNDALAKALITAGNTATDKCWRLPIGEEYQSQLDSPHADVCNVGGSEAGSITAACFLSRFTTKFPWAHLDIAGSAKDKTATGRPVPLLAQYLLTLSESA